MFIYTSGTRAQDHTQRTENIYLHLYIDIHIQYVYRLLPIAYCLLPVACGSRRAGQEPRPEEGPAEAEGPWTRAEQFMRHGHEMLSFLRGSFSESEFPLD